MRIEVDLEKCQDHGQCVFAAPDVFSLDEQGRLALRHDTDGRIWRSGDVDEALRDDVEEAADVCPMQAIVVLD